MGVTVVVLLILAAVVLFFVFRGMGKRATNNPASDPRSIDAPDLDLATHYFLCFARMLYWKAEEDGGRVRISTPEAAEFRESFIAEQDGTPLSRRNFATIEAHAISFTKHALRVSDVRRIELIATYIAGLANTEIYEAETAEIRNFLRTQIK